MGKIISFSGAQSSGKTTLLNACKKQSAEVLSVLNGFEFVPEVTRLVRDKYNLKINEDGNDLTQICIINQHIENYLLFKDKKVIMDRCILDGLVYTEYLVEQKIVSPFVYDYASEIYSKLINEIDIIFYTDPSIPLIDDGERSVNMEFRNQIIHKFNRYISKMSNVITLYGSVQDRLDTIKRVLIKNESSINTIL